MWDFDVGPGQAGVGLSPQTRRLTRLEAMIPGRLERPTYGLGIC